MVTRSLAGVAVAALSIAAVTGGCSSNSPAPSSESIGTTQAAVQGGTTDTAHPYAGGVCLGNKGQG